MSETTAQLKAFFDLRAGFSIVVLGAFLFSAFMGQFWVDFDPEAIDLTQRLCSPSFANLLGCDNFGRDVAVQLVKGAATTLSVACITVVISLSIGCCLGIISGYLGGWIDFVIMGIVDIFMAFPGILLALALSSLLGPRLENVVIAICATGWTAPARLARAQVLSFKERDYITAARCLGASEYRILRRHILPFLLTPLCILASFSISGVILVEASLSFLGVGAPVTEATWGTLLMQGREVLVEAPFMSVGPGLAIALVVLALNFLGDRLRDVFDPKHT